MCDRYDLILRNAEVIDPSQEIRQVADLAILDGRIAALQPSLNNLYGCAEIDLRGKYLCPGLIDLHGHWYEGSAFGIDPRICLNHGVTTVVDAGTTGFVNFAEFQRNQVERSPVRVLGFLNIAGLGIPSVLAGELEDLRYARPKETAAVLAAYTSVLLGVKVRIGSTATAGHGMEALRAALEAATACGLPLMVHISKGANTAEILKTLRPGDILTHCFQGRGDGLLRAGELLPEAVEARANGVFFDVGHGCGSFSWDVARRAFEHHYYPDTISTDLHRFSLERWAIDLPTTMSKFLHLGMSLEDVILKTTWAPARTIRRQTDIGSLRLGTVADVFVFSLEEGEFLLEDTHLKVERAARRIKPFLILRAGRVIEPGRCTATIRPLLACDLELLRYVEETA
ncbi:MAG: amidohydrolase/deacetylase family metallohydrolase [Acidobacteriota bacterium]